MDEYVGVDLGHHELIFVSADLIISTVVYASASLTNVIVLVTYIEVDN